jgi:GH18 family chitinase
MKNLAKKVAELQALIDKAKIDCISGIEVDSTWESVYEFDKIVLLKTRVVIYYSEWDGIKTKSQKDITMLSQIDDLKYALKWVERCIKKGYKEQAKEEELQRLDDLK